MEKDRRNMYASRFVIALFASLHLACSSDPLAPFEPEISNAADSFQFQATGLDGVSTTIEYAWQNTGTSANVNQASSVTQGVAQLVIRDDAGTEIYNRDLSANGTFSTTMGATGTWTVRVELTNVVGTLNFRAQKP